VRSAVFLDRYGVVNRAFVRDGKRSDLRILSGVRDACRSLKEAGFLLILVTNLPGDELLRRYLQMQPAKPWLNGVPTLLEAAREWDIDLSSSYFVADQCGTADTGERAGCRTIVIGNENREDQPCLVRSLREAANWILQEAASRLTIRGNSPCGAPGSFECLPGSLH
jgi:D-glycero-D-manno-heptose 1,7-bisphosphate phosphatase